MDWKIPLSDIDFGREEERGVQSVIQSKWLTMGEITRSFEKDFAEYNHVKHAIAVSSGTAALHLACVAAGLGPGDEVIFPALTFVATANAIRYTGATPVFADIESETNLNISPDFIATQIDKNTKAIMVMHYGGYPCDMNRIREIANHHNLMVIEDAAHAPGSELNGKKLGTIGDIGCFSFFSNKNLTTGEGGMIITNNDELATRMISLRSHGMTTLTWDRHEGHAWSYDVVDLGFNYRIDEIRSAIGRVQLNKLDKNNTARQELTRYYHRLLREDVPEITIPFFEHPGKSSCHLLPILLPEGNHRIKFMNQMKQHGIQTSIHYPPVYQFSIYKGLLEEVKEHHPVTENVSSREVTLPLYPTLTKQEIEFVIQNVCKALENC
jgi:dTDP-4-amino-4,6-dideoxygalactose transaminase